MNNLRVIYVGESTNVKYRIINNHCFGNVDNSTLRKHIAKELGENTIQIERIEKANKKYKKCYFTTNFIYEIEITRYILSGFWRILILDNLDNKEIKDFENYLIKKLNPELNKEKKYYNKEREGYYKEKFKELKNQCYLSCNKILEQKNLCKPGVYVFYHHLTPKEYNIKN